MPGKNPSLSELLFDPFFTQGVLFDTRDVFDMAPWPAFYFDRAALLGSGYIPEPPYARLLRKLGLFDPIEMPKIAKISKQSTFPVVVHSANALSQHCDRSEEDQLQKSISDNLKRDGSQIIGAIGEVFGETTRWAMGNLLGHLRDAADHIESRMQREQPKDKPPSSFYDALHSDIVSKFPEPSNEEKVFTYYHVTTRTMPDGSVETRKLLRDKDGSEKTTIIRHFPDPSKADEVTTIESPSENEK
ncbi:hypothetical protein IWW36_004100 [Coemansia brasiliensis]|uniref:Uncharacterized protein n=1 Tax=Coemansia brasiliensis TaxID=2650707 RepID=A0A9W8LZ45_9FUNG|nr:hypothetical protein IWW36_004100 [Coemansia brasiliensis]